MRQELEASLRREWEVKAQLEINRLVQIEIERLQKKFDHEVNQKVESELQRRSTSSLHSSKETLNAANEAVTLASSVGTTSESDFPSSTDLTDLSSHSPDPSKPAKRSTRTPFGRAQTMFAGQGQGTPMDVEMGEPSPISIASLSLSPRRNEATKAPNTGRNIFATAGAEARWQPTLIDSDASDDDDIAAPPSPTRNVKSSKNPFKSNATRPNLLSQKTAPVSKPLPQVPSLFGVGKAVTAPTLPTLSNVPDLRAQQSNSSLKERNVSPNRRLSKIPSSTNLSQDQSNSLSPTRKPSVKGRLVGDDLNKLATKNMANKVNVNAHLAPRGRTLVELAQARAGGRAIEDGTRSPEPKGRAFAQRMADKHRGSTEEPPVWDPERDEMPSPFLVRSKPVRKL
jgi:NIMA (never in mitosis gene a)-related kinase